MEILSLGEKIKKRRKELNMTLRDLAGDRITPGQISLVESGRSNPSMDLLEYLAKNLNSSVGYLIESEKSQADNICKLYIKMSYSYCLKREVEKAKEYLSKLIKISERYELSEREADILYLKSMILIIEKDYYSAQECAITANELFVKQFNHRLIVRSFLLLSRISIKMKAYYSAMTYISQAEIEYNDCGMLDAYVLSYIYLNKAIISHKLEDDKVCNEYIDKLDETMKLIFDKKLYSDKLIDKADRCLYNYDYEEAKYYIDRSVSYLENSENDENIARIEDMVGELLRAFNNIDESLKHFEVAKEFRVRNKNSKLYDTIINICECLLQNKDIERCKFIIDDVSRNIEEDDIESMTKINIIKYRMFMINEEDFQAEKCLLSTYKFIEENGKYEKLQSEIAIMLSKFYVNRRYYEEAKKYIDVGIEYAKKNNING